MADLKTKPTKVNVTDFLRQIEDPQVVRDCKAIVAIMKKATQNRPKMWGTSIIGFGEYHYKYKTGREGDWFLTGVSPRKQNISVYIMPGFSRYQALLKKLGKHKTGKCCLYIKCLADVDRSIFETLIQRSVIDIRSIYE